MTTEEFLKKIKERGVSVEEAPNLIKKAKQVGLPSEIITEIILETNNKEFIRECANDSDTPVRSPDRVRLIKAVNDSEFTLAMLLEKKGMFMTKEKAELIKSLDSPEEIITCLIAKELQLDSHIKANIVIEKQDVELVKQCLKTPQIMYPEDIKRVLQSVKDKGLVAYQQKDLIAYINDPEFTIQCLRDREIKLNQQDKVELIQTIEEPYIIKECLKDERLDLSPASKVKLIKATRDEKTIKEYMENPELGLKKQERLVLALEFGNDDLVQQLMAETTQKVKEIKIPEGMTVGIEIEAANLEVNNSIFKRWKSKKEESVENGAEYTSPILTGSKGDSEEIYFVCNALKTMGAIVNGECGGHIHIGEKFLTTAQSYRNLVELWCNSEEILYAISNKEGEITRMGAVEKHAVPLSGKVENALKKQQIYVDDRTREWDLLMEIIDIQKDRYSSINFKNYNHRIKETIEFRLSNGTLDPDVWVENINLFGGIMNSAERLASIQKKQTRTQEEEQYLRDFEELKDPTITQEEKLKRLLALAIPEEDRHIYQARYDTNMAMLEKSGLVLSEIREKTAKKPIDIGRIEQSLFTGEKAVKAQSIIEAERRLEQDRCRNAQETELEI